MADAPAAQPQAGQQQQQNGGLFRTVLNFVSIYLLVNAASSFFFRGDQQAGSNASTSAVGRAAGRYAPAWPPQTEFSLRLTFVAYFPDAERPVLNESLLLLDANATSGAGSRHTYEQRLLGECELDGLTFNDSFPETTHSCTLNLLECARRNCSLVAEVLAEPTTPTPSDGQPLVRLRRRTLMTGWLLETKPKERNLFDEDNAAPVDAVQLLPNSDRVVHFLRPNLILNLIADWTAYAPGSVPDPVKQHLKFADPPQREAEPAEKTEEADEEVAVAPPASAPAAAVHYLPILYVNHFWTLKEHLLELNETTLVEGVNETRSISLSYYPLSMLKFLLYVQMDASFDQQESFGTMAKGERDDTKRIFLETNPILLAVTAAVSLLHLVFEYLAFSNDVKFWRGKKDFKGLSVRSVVLNCYFQLIIFLYLLDGETSWTVVLPSGIGVLIEFWKLRKVMRVSMKGTVTASTTKEGEHAKATLFQRLQAALPFTVEFTQSYRGRTKRYDEVAMRWLFILGVPCLIGYSGYSALYHSYKGWYSFFIRTQVRFIYFSGFVMMCPQIFINYKLKCVAHMPWRTFTYKALNTVIDDLFAFIIKMPTMHRLACFRDDVVFLILLYQRWIYPVNPKMTIDGGLDESDDEPSATDTGSAIVAPRSASIERGADARPAIDNDKETKKDK